MRVERERERGEIRKEKEIEGETDLFSPGTSFQNY
jgi:hypothetical protein